MILTDEQSLYLHNLLDRQIELDQREIQQLRSPLHKRAGWYITDTIAECEDSIRLAKSLKDLAGDVP